MGRKKNLNNNEKDFFDDREILEIIRRLNDNKYSNSIKERYKQKLFEVFQKMFSSAWIKIKGRYNLYNLYQYIEEQRDYIVYQVMNIIIEHVNNGKFDKNKRLYSYSFNIMMKKIMENLQYFKDKNKEILLEEINDTNDEDDTGNSFNNNYSVIKYEMYNFEEIMNDIWKDILKDYVYVDNKEENKKIDSYNNNEKEQHLFIKKFRKY